jgi:hypothetical protein
LREWKTGVPGKNSRSAGEINNDNSTDIKRKLRAVLKERDKREGQRNFGNIVLVLWQEIFLQS